MNTTGNYNGQQTKHDMQTMGSFYNLKAIDIDKKEVNFSQYDGKVALVTNVASE